MAKTKSGEKFYSTEPWCCYKVHSILRYYISDWYLKFVLKLILYTYLTILQFYPFNLKAFSSKCSYTEVCAFNTVYRELIQSVFLLFSSKVFQRRQDGSTEFYRTWNDYKQGFGSLDGEHWLGNDRMHRLTSQRAYELRIDLADWEGNTRYAVYDSFSVADESDYYRLSIGPYSGTAGNEWMVYYLYGSMLFYD